MTVPEFWVQDHLLCSPRPAKLPSLGFSLEVETLSSTQSVPQHLVIWIHEGQLLVSQLLTRQEGNATGCGKNRPPAEATGAGLRLQPRPHFSLAVQP